MYLLNLPQQILRHLGDRYIPPLFPFQFCLLSHLWFFVGYHQPFYYLSCTHRCQLEGDSISNIITNENENN